MKLDEGNHESFCAVSVLTPQGEEEKITILFSRVEPNLSFFAAKSRGGEKTRKVV